KNPAARSADPDFSVRSRRGAGRGGDGDCRPRYYPRKCRLACTSCLTTRRECCAVLGSHGRLGRAEIWFGHGTPSRHLLFSSAPFGIAPFSKQCDVILVWYPGSAVRNGAAPNKPGAHPLSGASALRLPA